MAVTEPRPSGSGLPKTVNHLRVTTARRGSIIRTRTIYAPIVCYGPRAVRRCAACACASAGDCERRCRDAASNVTLTSIAPQVLIAIKGQNLAIPTAASGYPLPTQLGGATVSFSTSSGTVLAPLFNASSTQMNAQVPNGIAGTSIVVTTAAGSSAPYNIPLVSGSIPEPIGQLGIFYGRWNGMRAGGGVQYPFRRKPTDSELTAKQSRPQEGFGAGDLSYGIGRERVYRFRCVPWVYNGSDNPVPQLASSGTSLTSVTFGAPGLTASASNLSLTYLGLVLQGGYRPGECVSGKDGRRDAGCRYHSPCSRRRLAMALLSRLSP